MAELDDATLLKRIAKRDEAAFAQLYERHAQAAASLAFHIVGNSSMAEEAVQNGMVKVWKAAASFRHTSDAEPVHNARAWIMKIMAREGYQLLRKKRRLREVVPQSDDTPAKEAAHDSSEALQALRAGMQELPEDERQLLALHFGGGLTQFEVGEVLELTQQAVSYRLNKALKTLRTRLAAAGVTGVGSAAMINASNMQDMMLTTQVPLRLSADSVLETIRSAPTGIGTAHPLRKAAAAQKSSAAGAWVAAGVLCAAAVAFLAIPAKRPPPPAVPPAPVVAPVAAPGPAPVRSPSWRYTFEKGAPADLVVVGGDWQWLEGAKAMQIRDTTSIAMETPRLNGEPYLLQTRGEILPGAIGMSHGLLLLGPEGEVGIKEHWRLGDIRFDKPVREFRCYMVGRYLVEYFGDKPVRVIVHTRELNNTGIMMRVENMILSQIELKPVSEADLPADVRDLQKLTSQMVRVDHLTPQQQNEMLRKAREQSRGLPAQ
ncbi:MAG TPA: sigma-70 family RNA polymerase sigma factor [Planctomycetota bacterium]|nr:sigma-70 family RNA polymerase sigma factor [Planctomycetota bacterium]